MDAIERRAREMLASAYADTGAPPLLVEEVRGGEQDTASDNAALRAIIAALTPPEGYVLVPVEPPVSEIWSVIKGDGLASIDQIDGENPDSARHQHLGWLQLAWPELLSMLVARAEVGQ